MRVTTAAEAAQRDADAIASGIDDWSLMLQAGTAAARVLLQNYPDRLGAGALIYAGPGNNGGDAYVVAARLIEAGIDVTMLPVGEPKTANAKRAAELYQRATRVPSTSQFLRIVVDGVLGTGQRGQLRDAERDAATAINEARIQGAIIIALDLPTGVDASTGDLATDAVRADHTIAFGTLKRAHLLQRGQVGAVTIVDIGLGEFSNKADGAWTFADHAFVSARLPDIAWNAHKGTRGRTALVGGDEGMAGAIILASHAALRSGAGLVYTHTAQASRLALQIAVPQAVSRVWPVTRGGQQIPTDDLQAIAIGPGLGRGNDSERVLRMLLDEYKATPTVLDADALTLFSGFNSTPDDDLDEQLDHATRADRTIEALRALSATRPVVCTPHVGEFARLIDRAVAPGVAARAEQATEFAKATGVVLLLKGTPTQIFTPDGAPPIAVATGTQVLATGGSGDLLTGIIGALLGQGSSAADAAVIAAWVHGRAAEIATSRAGVIRGVTLNDVLAALAEAWRELATASALPTGVLALLPASWT